MAVEQEIQGLVGENEIVNNGDDASVSRVHAEATR